MRPISLGNESLLINTIFDFTSGCIALTRIRIFGGDEWPVELRHSIDLGPLLGLNCQSYIKERLINFHSPAAHLFLDFGLLGQLERIIHIDSKVSDRAF